MGLCWRSSPLVALVLIVGHLTSWFGIASTKAAATTSASVTSASVTSLPVVGGLLSGAGSVVGQIFMWLFVLMLLQILFSLLSFAMAEIRLRRMYDRPSGGRWARVVGTSFRREPDDGAGHGL